MKWIFSFAFFLILTSCAPPEVENNDLYIERIPPEESRYLSGDFTAREGIYTSFDLTSKLPPLPSGVTYYLSPYENMAGLNFNFSTGILSGIPEYDNGDIENNVYEMTISAKDGTTELASAEVMIVVNGDPLRQETWHLNNTGQDAFTGHSSASGVDIKAFEAWKLGYTGKGINVAVSDSGVNIDHNDLYENASAGKHRNYALDAPFSTDYPYPTSPHGTAVAGLIGAKGWNNEGGTGVAPDATISGFQFLGSSNFSNSEMISQASGNYRIFNYSYGDYYNFPQASDQLYLDHIETMSLSTPSKFYVKAAGNEYKEFSESNYFCGSHNANFPMENESPYMIVVGAVNADGEKASYSSAGSNIWVSALGGEFGTSSPALITTDLPTCFLGYAQTIPISTNPFEFGHALNPKCNYTASMNGTSGATPIVSGVLALMLEANPNLSNRDAKHILALTSTKVDPTSSSGDIKHMAETYSCNPLSKPVSFNIPGEGAWTYAQGWMKNKGVYTHINESSSGLNFHNFYGFGLVNAYEAVKLSQALKEGSVAATNAGLPLPPQESISVSSGVISLVVPTKPDVSEPYVEDVRAPLEPSDSSDFIVESVQATVVLKHEYSIGELGVELISPQGTRSILADVNNTYMFKYNPTGTLTLTSHAFYGERADGDYNDDTVGGWKIRIIDGAEGEAGHLQAWSLTVLGHRQ